MADILQNINCKTVHQQICNNQQEGEQPLANLANHKKLSAGVVFKAGKAWLGSDVLVVQLEWKRIRSKGSKSNKISKGLKWKGKGRHMRKLGEKFPAYLHHDGLFLSYGH
jgi:hypothetical protein